MKDWFLHDGIDPDDAEMLTQLDELRSEEPVLWALVQGYGTSESLAKLIGWPHDFVLGRLRQYKEDGIVQDMEGTRRVHWALIRPSDFDALILWIMRQKQPLGLFRQIDRNDE